jgi:hypothetical protein
MVGLATVGHGPAPAAAQQAGLAGRWTGPGTIILPSGAKERARCRATFNRGAGRAFTMSAICATASIRVAQSARVQQIGTNRYTGEFVNAEYNITGVINLTLSGPRLIAALRGGGGTAYFTLRR